MIRAMRKLLTPTALTVCGFIALAAIWTVANAPDNAMWLYVPWLRGNALKFLIGGAALLLWAGISPGGKSAVLPVRVALPAILLGAATALPLLLAAPWDTPLRSLWTASPGNGVAISAAMPLVFAWLYPWFDRPILRPSSWFWLIAGFFGALLLAWNAVGTGWRQGIAVPANLVELVLAALAFLLVKKRMRGISPIVIAGVQCLTMGLILAVASLLAERDSTQWSSLAVPLLEQALGAAAIGYALFLWLLQRMEAHKLGLIFPVILFLSALPFALGEGFSTPWNVVGGLVLIFGAFVMAMREPKQEEESISLLSTPGEL